MYLVFYILGLIVGGILVFVFTRKRDICGELHIIQEKNEEPKLFISIKDIDSIRNKHIVEFVVKKWCALITYYFMKIVVLQ